MYNSLPTGKWYMFSFVVCCDRRMHSGLLAIRLSNSLDPDLVPCGVGSDLGPNCLKRLSADSTSM